MTAVLRFSLTDVKEKGASSVDVSVEPGEFPGIVDAGELSSPLHVTGTLAVQDDEAAFQGEARGRWRIECTRCLAPVEVAYAASIEAKAPVEAGSLDLTDEVRQALVLAQPMKIYCRSDCRGLCPVCRKNRNQTDCGHKQS